MARSAKAPHGSKSQAIRDYLAGNPAAKGSEVVAALAEKGIKVSLPAVYNLKARDGKSKGNSKTRGGKSGDISLGHLFAAKKLVEAVGSVQQAREAIDALAKLV